MLSVYGAAQGPRQLLEQAEVNIAGGATDVAPSSPS